MPNNKGENQYFGKYFERCIVEHINQTEIILNPQDFEDTKGYNFSEEEIKEINSQAKKIADYIGYDKTAKHIGNHTSTQAGDISLGDENIEIKRVSAGSGTYHNTSIYYLIRFGFDFHTYMEKYGLYDVLEKYFPNVRVSKKNNSPVNQQASSAIRHSNNLEGLKELEETDLLIRKIFINDLKDYFLNHQEDAYIFFKDMLNKVRVHDEQYYCPDRLIVYNYTKDSINELNLTDYSLNNISNTDLALKLGALRLQIGWQNGNGLNNPTIRVFLD